jgi:hypothetical protein
MSRIGLCSCYEFSFQAIRLKWCLEPWMKVRLFLILILITILFILLVCWINSRKFMCFLEKWSLLMFCWRSIQSEGQFKSWFGCLGKCRRLGACRMRTLTVINTDPDVGTYNIVIQVFGQGVFFKMVVTLFHDTVECAKIYEACHFFYQDNLILFSLFVFLINFYVYCASK